MVCKWSREAVSKYPSPTTHTPHLYAPARPFEIAKLETQLAEGATENGSQLERATFDLKSIETP
jgi:hypothetical protein